MIALRERPLLREVAAESELAGDLALALDPVLFAQRAGITPYPWQAAVLRSTAPQRILNCARQSGKSRTVAVLVLHTAAYHPESLTLIISPSERQSKLLLDKVYQALGKVGSRATWETDAENRLYLRLANGSQVYALQGSKPQTLRGFSDVTLLVIDEASRCLDDTYYGCRPMVAASQGSIVLLSTPFGMRGFFHHEWAEGDGWERTLVRAEDVPHFSSQWLANERARIGEWWYAQEYECQFVDREDQLFATDLVLGALTPDVAPLVLPMFGGVSG